MLWSELFAKLLLARVINNYHLLKFVFSSHQPCCHGSFTFYTTNCHESIWQKLKNPRVWFITSGYSVSENMIQVSAIYNNIQTTVLLRIEEKLIYHSYENTVSLSSTAKLHNYKIFLIVCFLLLNK